jgi:AraC-like DNA-binding protein
MSSNDGQPLAMALPALDHAGRYLARGRCPWHAHRGFELLAVRRGRCTVELEGQPPLPAGPGSVVLIPPRCAHIHHDRTTVATAYAIFRLPPRLLPARVRRLTVAAGDPLLGWLDQVVDLHRAPGRGDPRAAGGLLLAILARLDLLDPPAPSAPRPRALALAEAHLERHLGGEVAMDALAAVAGVTPGHLRTLFREHHGCPPARWHRRQRIALAQRLLRDPRLAVAEVAAACGWRGGAPFGRAFRAETGRTPGGWRRGR